tara:strand:- start:16794 stop:17561 length:768 start_codon:yes stop_codon:yes gene_type:complete
MKIRILAVLCVAFLVNSCSEDNDINAVPIGITLNFSHSWGETAITSADFNDLNFVNENEDTLSITRLRYLISEITLTHESGVVTTLDDYNLVDVTNNEGLSFTTSTGILPGDYTSITFRFGFSEENNTDGIYTDLNTESFNVPEMLGGGYHYMQFDGSYINNSAMESPFSYHMISAIDLIAGTPREDTSFVLNIGAVNVGGNTNINIDMDVSEWFKTPNTWDLNVYDIDLMSNYDAQLLMSRNGTSVFSLVDIIE